MATDRTHRYLGGARVLKPESLGDQLELDEAEVWNTGDTILPKTEKTLVSNSCTLRKPVRNSVDEDHSPVRSKSIPVNVPDWSKILRGEYTKRAGEWEGDYDNGDEVEEKDGNDRTPPHEFLARTRVASMSVHEGRGRTLKGRDLSRVRTAILKKIGFED